MRFLAPFEPPHAQARFEVEPVHCSMPAAHRSRCISPFAHANPSSAAGGRGSKPSSRPHAAPVFLGPLANLLLGTALSACSANRFDSTENAARPGESSDPPAADGGFSTSRPRFESTSVDATSTADAAIAETYEVTSDAPSLTRQTSSTSDTAGIETERGDTAGSSPTESSSTAPTSITFDTNTTAGGSPTSTWPSAPSTGAPSGTGELSSHSSDLSTDPVDETTHLSSVELDAGADASLDETSAPTTTEPHRDAGGADGSAPSSTATSPSTAVTSTSSSAQTSDQPLDCKVTRTLPGIVRDFAEDHPDMEPCDEVDCRSETGMLEAALGPDDKPVLSASRATDSTVHSAETFNQWFNDVEGVNVAVPFALRITTQRYLPPQKIGFDSADPPPASPAGFGVDPEGFFPIDELNATTRPHNYSFTYEVTSFIEYTGGETLTVRGDDDIFVFIDKKLVIDLGGIHLPQEATVDLDDLGLEPDRAYDFRLFFAERHVEQSNLFLSTTARFMACTRGD